MLKCENAKLDLITPQYSEKDRKVHFSLMIPFENNDYSILYDSLISVGTTVASAGTMMYLKHKGMCINLNLGVGKLNIGIDTANSYFIGLVSSLTGVGTGIFLKEESCKYNKKFAGELYDCMKHAFAPPTGWSSKYKIVDYVLEEKEGECPNIGDAIMLEYTSPERAPDKYPLILKDICLGLAIVEGYKYAEYGADIYDLKEIYDEKCNGKKLPFCYSYYHNYKYDCVEDTYAVISIEDTVSG